MAAKRGSTSGRLLPARLQQLQALRDQQRASEQTMGMALGRASSELEFLQERSKRCLESAETEVVELSESLQQSMRMQSDLDARVRFADKASAELSALRVHLLSERDHSMSVLRKGALELADREAALQVTRASKERLLRDLHEQRLLGWNLAEDIAMPTSSKAALQADVCGLRQKALHVARADVVKERIQVCRHFHLLRVAFVNFACGSRIAQGHRCAFDRMRAQQLLTIGQDAYKRWQRQAKLMAWQRQRQLAVLACLILAWALLVAERRWLAHQIPAAASLHDRWLLRRWLRSWSCGARARLAAEHHLARRKLCIEVFQRWCSQVRGWWHLRFLHLQCCKRCAHVLLLGRFGAWSACVHAIARRATVTRKLRRRLNLLQSKAALRFWAAVPHRLKCKRPPPVALFTCWHALREHALSSRSECMRRRTLAAFIVRVFRCFAILVEAGHRVRMSAISILRSRALRGTGVEAFSAWVVAASMGCKLRRSTQMLRRWQCAQALGRWYGRACAVQVVHRLCARGEQLATLRMSARRQCCFGGWVAAKQAKQRLLAHLARTQCQELRVAWSLWLRALCMLRREMQDSLHADCREARFALGELAAAAQLAQVERSEAEAKRFSLADELRQAAADREELGQLLAKEHREAAEAKAEAGRVAVVESAAASKMAQQVASLRSRRAQGASQREARREALAEELAVALAAPAALRANLRKSEAAARLAADEELKARQSAEALRLELEDLHRRAAAHLAGREAVVAALRCEAVLRERRSEPRALGQGMASQPPLLHSPTGGRILCDTLSNSSIP